MFDIAFSLLYFFIGICVVKEKVLKDNSVDLKVIEFKGCVREKLKGGLGLRRKFMDGFRYLSTSICCIYKENFGKNDSYRAKNVASTQIQKVATYDLDRKQINLIPNKSFCYYNL